MSFRNRYEAMKSWIEEGLHVTAVIPNNDLIAVGVIAAANVPIELSFIGFDDTVAAAFQQPATNYH
ncbi:substrate-binding domain-containing protein [Paenibacillus sp. GCM10027626]|uniref:substrate-binding domain-containing protein n=1 Tax=Paenibacillus sp. GCM10027626 TaxID=3273411 RepID=UPI00363B2DC0